jgi:glycolate oxidase subunit GlcD
VPAVDYDKLRSALSENGRLITDLADYEAYTHDATADSGTPGAIVFASNANDVRATVLFCHKHNLPIVPRGAGTGLSGGCVPSEGALVLSTEALDEIEIMPEEKIAVCGPGVITRDLIDGAEAVGLTYAPDPASYTESTLGGNVAENAGGLRCVKYGVTRDYVIGLQAITADGCTLDTGWFTERPAFELGELLIGSEGTLAIITSIAVSLVEPSGRGTTILAAFGEPSDAARTVFALRRAGLVPTVMEFMDGDAIDCSNAYEPTEGLHKAAALLLFETDPHHHDMERLIEGICSDNHCTLLRTEPDPNRAEDLWRVRRNLSKAITDMAALRVSEDVAVPISRFADLVAFVDQMNHSSHYRINAFGHAGDGNLHVSFLSEHDTSRDRENIDSLVETLMRKTIELDGTLTGEHGIGLAKRRLLPLEFDPPTLQFMRHIKDAFDPTGIMNPDKIFPV